MSLFDGVTGLFEGVFDSPVTITKAGGGAVRVVRGIFREEPVALGDLDMEILSVQPVLKLRLEAAGDIARGDLVTVAARAGVSFEVLSVQPSRSPAADRHIMAILTEVTAP